MKNDEPNDAIDERLMKVLACPVCVAEQGGSKAVLELSGGKLVCRNCGRRYAIVDGIPNMLPEEAEQS
jgi:uncharacterized protein YbaR (Trm112 family)